MCQLFDFCSALGNTHGSEKRKVDSTIAKE